MTWHIAVRGLLIWFLILLMAVANAGLREAVLIPWLGSVAGLALSGLTLSALILALTWFALPWLGARSSGCRLLLGLGWLLLTLMFEFSFGLWQGKSWGTLLAAYRFQGGNLWPLVLLTITGAPWLVGKARGGSR